MWYNINWVGLLLGNISCQYWVVARRRRVILYCQAPKKGSSSKLFFKWNVWGAVECVTSIIYLFFQQYHSPMRWPRWMCEQPASAKRSLQRSMRVQRVFISLSSTVRDQDCQVLYWKQGSSKCFAPGQQWQCSTQQVLLHLPFIKQPVSSPSCW